MTESKNEPQVTRSVGLPIRVGACFYGMAGGGYSGATEELDATVAHAAELLSGAFGRNVEIRFNSDRQSGGAWLKNSLEGFAGNCQVGLNARLGRVQPDDWSRETMLNAALDYTIPRSELRQRYDALPEVAYISTYVDVSVLKDKSLANAGVRQDRCGTEHETLEDAVRWLGENIDREAILD